VSSVREVVVEDRFDRLRGTGGEEVRRDVDRVVGEVPEDPEPPIS
jgi:hypothetical protein